MNNSISNKKKSVYSATHSTNAFTAKTLNHANNATLKTIGLEINKPNANVTKDIMKLIINV